MIWVVNNLPWIRVKGGESECLRIDSGVKYGFIMSLWLFNVYMDAVIKREKMTMRRMRVRFQDEERKWRLPCLLVCVGSQKKT